MAYWIHHTLNPTEIVVGTSTTETYERLDVIPVEALGRPPTNPPTVVIQDNLTLLSFTLNTERVAFKFPLPADYVSGPLSVACVWTNDGGTDDNGRNVRWQMSFQTANWDESVAGDHAHSPLILDDTYESTQGWILHQTPYMAIEAADLKHCQFLRLMALTPLGSALTCEPHLVGVCRKYLARRVLEASS